MFNRRIVMHAHAIKKRPPSTIKTSMLYSNNVGSNKSHIAKDNHNHENKINFIAAEDE